MATAKSESRVVSHTPGPWKWIELAGLSFLVSESSKTIVLDDVGCNPQCCNPRDEPLIAAAPDLLEAIQAILQKPTALGAAVMLQAQAAINKAKGGV